MDIKDVKRKERPKLVRLNLKTDREVAKWMKDNNVSPQLIFDKAVEGLMKRK